MALSKLDPELLNEARDLAPPAPATSNEPDDMQPGRRSRPSRLPEGRLTNTFESFQLPAAPGMEAAYQRCLSVAEGLDWCAFLYGTPGTGKTHLAAAALNAWHERERNGIFWKVPDFLAFLRRSINSEHTNPDLILDAYTPRGFLLVLDDYGAHNATDWAEEQLYRLIDQRYENKGPTIVTSNVELDATDLRVRSRLRGGFVLCEASDWRAKG